MTGIHIDTVEALWIAINFAALILMFSALLDARADQRAVKFFKGATHELSATGSVRRESLRVIVVTLLLLVVIPGIFDDRPTPVNFFVLVMMAVPLILLISSLYDARDRKAMTIMVAAELLSDQTTTLSRIEEKLDKNTEISREASDAADKAYQEANNVNNKIASQGKTIVSQGRAAKTRDTNAVRMEATVDDTHKKVGDIHDTIPKPSKPKPRSLLPSRRKETK